jgi:hypothetical protein
MEYDRRDMDKIVDKGDLTEKYINPELQEREPGTAVDASGETVEQYARRLRDESRENEDPFDRAASLAALEQYPDPNSTM